MTAEQNKKIQKLVEKHNIPENSITYFLMLLGVGYDMEIEQIEDYLFRYPNANMIEKDLLRCCLFFGFEPSVLKGDNPVQSLRDRLNHMKDRCKRYDIVFQKLGVTLEDAEGQPSLRLTTFSEGNPSTFYSQVIERIMENKQFSAAQLEQLTKAVELSMPEDEILKFAEPDKTPLQMEKYIEFYMLRTNQDQKKSKKMSLMTRIFGKEKNDE